MSTHNPVMEIHKKFSIPVACFVFALIGLALGASNRKDGKLASFVLGIGVIFVYYVVMFSAQAMTKGVHHPRVALDVAAQHRPRHRRRRAAGVARPLGRPADSHRAAPLALPRLGRRSRGAPSPQRPRQSRYRRDRSQRRRGGRVVLVVRIPQFDLPRPNLLDVYVARQYLRILA